MHFSWLGTTAVKIQTKPLAEEVIIVIDPYRPKTGSFPRNLSANIALYTRGEENSITISGSPFVLSTPGECEIKGVLITATHGHEPNTTFLRLDAEQLTVGHLGLANKLLTDEQLEVLSDVDVLFVPVGGQSCYDAEAAVKAVNAIEPRIIIPIAYKTDNNPDLEKVDHFLQEMGVSNGAPEKKVIIKKKDLPTAETRVIVLGKE